MTRLSVFCRALLFLCLSLWLAGCSPITSETDADDRKNPDLAKGLSRKNAMDYKGAIEAFESALERNPRSAVAHLELGLLYEQNINDYATAIHHYQKHLKFQPNSRYAEMIRGRISSCKLELAKSVALSAVDQQVHSAMSKLTTENALLRQEVQQLKMQLAQHSNATPNIPAVIATHSSPLTNYGTELASDVRQEKPLSAKPVPETLRARRHEVALKETAFAICRRYNIHLADLRAANPGVNLERLHPGQWLNLPVLRN